MANSGALATLETNTVLTRYHTETIAQIAESLGVSDVAIYLKLIKESPEDWKSHQAAKALWEYEQAQEGMKGAQDALSLARARELVRSAQWKLERVCRRIYGQDTVPEGSQAVQININLRSEAATTQRSNERIIDAEVVTTTKD